MRAKKVGRSPSFLQPLLNSLDQTGQRVWTHAALKRLFTDTSPDVIPESVTFEEFLKLLLDQSHIVKIPIGLPHRGEVRYTRNDPPLLEIVQSLSPKGYFSHYTAVYLHGLTTQVPRSIYFNREQPLKGGGGTLTQVAIDRAFRGKGRTTNNVTTLSQRELYGLSGQNTGELGVIEFSSTEGNGLRVSNIERTLIDATVRPYYSGGIHEVAGAFEAAAERVSINRLTAYLRKLNFTYPYHQAIGYYLQRTQKFHPDDLMPLKEAGLDFDFYLTYAMKETTFVPEWRLHIPKGFET